MNDLQVIHNDFLEYAPIEKMTDVSHDDDLISMWLDGLSPASRRTYKASLDSFRTFTSKPLQAVKVEDLQSFKEDLFNRGLSSASVSTRIAALKSLFSYGQKIGYLRFNVGAALRSVKVTETISERILSRPDVVRVIALESDPRNKAILTLLYTAGLRVSELCGLSWKHLNNSGSKTALTVHGKGGKTRYIPLQNEHAAMLQKLDNDKSADSPIFRSNKGGHLDPSMVYRIVQAAAKRAEIDKADDVSPHWLRHAHATHALQAGCAINVVMGTLGHSSLQITTKYTHMSPDEGSSLYLTI